MTFSDLLRVAPGSTPDLMVSGSLDFGRRNSLERGRIDIDEVSLKTSIRPCETAR